MKKIFTYTLMLLMAAVTFTSCEPDPDADLAYDIAGVWQGSIDGNFYINRYRSNSYDTEISFTRRDMYGGTGYEVDYNLDTRRYSYIDFDWTVRNNRIIIDYHDGYSVIVRDYEVYSMRGALRFRGYFDDYDTREELAHFNLVKVEDQNDSYYMRYSRYYLRGSVPGEQVTAADSLKKE